MQGFPEVRTTMNNNYNFSKSRYCEFVQCPRRAWLHVHKPEEMRISEDAEVRMRAGQELGEIAKGLFGKYVDMTAKRGESLDLPKMESRTWQAIKEETPVICEALFNYQGQYCAVDILRKTEKGWAIYEVKSSTRVKDIHIPDIAYQLYVLRKCGINVTDVYIVLVNRDYIYNGKLSTSQLFVVLNATKASEVEQDVVAEDLEIAAELMSEETEPQYEVTNARCKYPYLCPFYDHCSEGVKYQNLRPESIDQYRIKEFLDSLWYPLIFMDFETIQPVIPKYIGTSPYDQIPFQYSIHSIENEGAKIEHKEFLAEPGTDPRRAFAERLIEDVPPDACIVVYNKSFECTRLKELAGTFPDLRIQLLSIRDRIYDLMVPFQKGWYYTKAMGDSYSIKAVLPAMFPNDPELDYKKLDGVHNGTEAMTTFPLLGTLPPEKKEKMRQSLLKYCELDTLAMVRIYERLKEIANEK